MKLTGETITDKQIYEVTHRDPSLLEVRMIALHSVVPTVKSAARARCAEIFNSRVDGAVVKTFMVITGERDGLGRASFTLFWSDPDGVYRPEPSKEDGEPVGFRRAQCFKAVPEEYLARPGVKLAVSEAAAKTLAWGGR